VKSRASVFVPERAILCLQPPYSGSQASARCRRPLCCPRPPCLGTLSSGPGRLIPVISGPSFEPGADIGPAWGWCGDWRGRIRAAASRRTRDGRHCSSLAAVWVTLAHKRGSRATMLTTA